MRIVQVRALIVMGILAVVAVITSWYAIVNDTQTAAGREMCSPGDIPVDIELPEEKDINVKVLNSTDNSGLAESASESLEEYGFNIEETGNSKDELDVAVLISYGPKAVAGGHLLRAYFADPSVDFSLDNDTDYVKVTLGPGFQQVNTKSDARIALSIIGRPEAPEGTCPIE